MEKTYEVCPYCGEEVELDAELKVQECPHCHMSIVTCSMCLAVNDCDEPYCQHCCLEYLAHKMNEDLDNQLSKIIKIHKECEAYMNEEAKAKSAHDIIKDIVSLLEEVDFVAFDGLEEFYKSASVISNLWLDIPIGEYTDKSIELIEELNGFLAEKLD